MISMPEMIAVSEMILAPRKLHSSLFYEALAGKTVARKAMSGKTGETAASSEMRGTTTKMATAAPEMSTAEAATTSTMATTSSTMCERCDGRKRYNAGQNQTDR